MESLLGEGLGTSMKKRDGTELLEIKPVSLKRKAILDSEKVRYKVYLSAHEYVVVIAPNALMALKLSGIENPVRILRDVPMSKTSIEEKRVVAHNERATAFLRPDMPLPPSKGFIASMDELSDNKKAVFEPVSIGKSLRDSPIIPSSLTAQSLLSSIIDGPQDSTPYLIESDASFYHKRAAQSPRINDDLVPLTDETKPEITQGDEPVEQIEVKPEESLSNDDIDSLLNAPRA